MKRHKLTREQKIYAIKDNDSSNGLSTRKLAEKYAVLTSSVVNILNRSSEYQGDCLARVGNDCSLSWLESIQTEL